MWRSIRPSPERKRRRHPAVRLGLVLTLLCAAAGADEPVILAVNLNGIERDEIITARYLSDGSLAVAQRDLLDWGLKLPVTGRLSLDGLAYVRLADLPEIAYSIEPDSQSLRLNVPAGLFEGHALAYGLEGDTVSTPTIPGGFLNYDLNWQRQDGTDQGGGLFEIGFFNTWGSGTATTLWDATTGRWVRLDTTWTLDMPDKMQSLRLGDAIGIPGTWGRAVRFGGLQWATNFATRPGFVTFPLPSLRGEASLPSTLDVFLDNARVVRDDVPAGPFDLNDIPVVTGQGELRMVVRDLLGRQQVISQPYYASPLMLRPGLRDFAWEIGFLREDYGLASSRYGRGMLALTERQGIGPGFTREWRAEVAEHQQTLGAGGVWLLPAQGAFLPGTLSLDAAASHGPDGYGALYGLGLEHRSSHFNFGLQARHAGRNFVQLGLAPDITPRLTLSANLGWSLGGQGLGLGYVRQTTWQGDDRRLLSASYSVGLGRAGQFGVFALRNLGDPGGYSLTAVWSMALDADTGLHAGLDRQDGRNRATVQVQRNTPPAGGIGYRLLLGDDRRYQAAATLQTDRATAMVEAARADGQTGFRAGVSGGIAVAAGGVFPSRRIDGSFAVVKVGDFAGVRVYRDNQEVARTDQRGLAMISQLRAYEKNPVAIEPADLPMDAEVDTLQLKLTPALRSGVVAAFPVRRGRNARLRLVDDNGRALPSGVSVRVEGDAREFPVGFDGQVFLTGLAGPARLSAEWPGHRCTAELAPGDAVDPLPDLGTLICKGATP
ncbi:MAG: fimbrial biogenesis outer membrane usher protein [Thiobacillus sp.]|nr:fimbrial biogenesis outer membrane usher protein [Thiobacillus sp.]